MANRLSVDERKSKILKFFHETSEFYQMKELEKLIPKSTGINVKHVKDAVQTLVDDGSVDVEKIGTTLCYWSFPSKTLNMRKRKLKELEKLCENKQKRLKTTDNEHKENIDEIQSTLKKIDELNKQKDQILKQLEISRKNDPELLDKMSESIDYIRILINDWTDNISTTITWWSNETNVDAAIIRQQFGIPKDLDYISKSH